MPNHIRDNQNVNHIRLLIYINDLIINYKLYFIRLFYEVIWRQ